MIACTLTGRDFRDRLASIAERTRNPRTDPSQIHGSPARTPPLIALGANDARAFHFHE